MVTMYIIHKGYLETTDDVGNLIADFSLLGRVVDKPSSQSDATNRQLWYALTGGGLKFTENIYKVPMPFLVRAAFKSCKAKIESKTPRYSILLVDADFEALGIPLTKEAVVLLAGTLQMQIKKNPEDEMPKKEGWWVPSRDFLLIPEQKPASRCYVEIFLTDLKYVSEFKIDSDPSLFDYVLNSSPTIRRAWDEFKGTFLNGE